MSRPSALRRGSQFGGLEGVSGEGQTQSDRSAAFRFLGPRGEDKNCYCAGAVKCSGAPWPRGDFIRSHGEKSMPTTASEACDIGFVGSKDAQNETLRIGGQKAFTVMPSSREQYSQEETSCLKVVAKYRVFLSHSGAQKPFVEQLSKDLEAGNHSAFFDQRSDCLPLGEKFPALILDAAKKCQVGVVVLSREYLSSKWPMLELVEFVRALKSENSSLRLFPIFFRASVADLCDESIQHQWRSLWEGFVGGDARVDLEEWAAAVRELRAWNGLSFEKFGNSEVMYRDAIVKGIVKLAPPDLLYDTSTTFGSDRICEILAGKFLPSTRTSAQVLGLYGMGGLGKTTMSKCLCNYFNREFSGRVCYIELKEGMNALERQLMVMRKLLRLDDLLLRSVCDVSQGWKLWQERMGMDPEPVFLVIDNVLPDAESKDEAQKYLNVKYNSGSKILVISRSLDVVEALLGDACYCCEIPCLTSVEAAGVLLQQGAPEMNYSSLTAVEGRVVRSCLKEVWFSSCGLQGGNHVYDSNIAGAGHYHPLALRALGVYLRESNKTGDLLSWKSCLHEYGMLKGTTDSYMHMLKILGLQFNTLDRMTQLMFLDIVLYARKALKGERMLSNSPLEDLVVWLANAHGVPTAVARSKIFEFKRFGMINIYEMETKDSLIVREVIVHDLYEEYATRLLEQVNREEVLGVWCVRAPNNLMTSLPLELQRSPAQWCWPQLERIRLENVHCVGFSKGKVQEWRNIVVLQIVECKNLTTISLQGLSCLHHLELKNLVNLMTLTFSGDRSSRMNSMPHVIHTVPPPLQFVNIEGLDSLECLPLFSALTSLKFLKVFKCICLTQPPSVQHCSGLERMWLSWQPRQKTLPSLDGLTSLRDLTIQGDSDTLLYEGGALRLEGLSSLSSLGALELWNIPVGDLSGLENLTRVEYISLGDLFHLTRLPSLEYLLRSSLHVLEVRGCKLEGLDEVNGLRNLKFARLRAEGEVVPRTPMKIDRTFVESKRTGSLRTLIPNGDKLDVVPFLERTNDYIRSLTLQIRMLKNDSLWPKALGPLPNTYEELLELAGPEI